MLNMCLSLNFIILSTRPNNDGMDWDLNNILRQEGSVDGCKGCGCQVLYDNICACLPHFYSTHHLN